ncbi:uncharacterized protein TNCV_4061931 [Trichonephila clavipes]|nr:uncharacterized protein TNCV_4061931 [Trichonephila clavipes]
MKRRCPLGIWTNFGGAAAPSSASREQQRTGIKTLNHWVTYRDYYRLSRPRHARRGMGANSKWRYLLISRSNAQANFSGTIREAYVAAVAEWYRHRIVAGFVTSSSPVPLKTRRVGQRLNLSRAETSSRWCGVVVRRGGASSGVVHVT